MIKLFLYRCVTFLAAPLLRLLLKLRVRQGKEDPARLSERFGIATILKNDTKKYIWFHAASAGEAQSVHPLLEKMAHDFPNFQFLLTTGTKTAADWMQSRLPENVVHQYAPWDRTPWVKNFLNYWQPQLLVLVESEIWPNTVLACDKNDIPVILINARLSQKSYNNWQSMRGMARAVMSKIMLVLAQNEQYANWYLELGVQNAEILPNLKFAAAPLPHDPNKTENLKTQIGDRPFWLAASTHNPEELWATQTHKELQKTHKNLLTIIIPRHPKRANRLVEKLSQMDVTVAQRSKNDPITQTTDIYIADTFGELATFFDLTDIVFMGGSLTPGIGGHNILEPAHFNCAIIHGAHMENTRDMESIMQDAGAAATVRDYKGLTQEISRLLVNKAQREKMQSSAKEIVAQHSSVLQLYEEFITSFLPEE